MIEKPRYSHAGKLATKLLLDVKLNAPPIDLDKILKFLNINLLEYEFPPNISAILLKDENMLVVGVNKSHHPNRQRFSIAHEIGHYQLGHYNDVFIDTAEISSGRFDYDNDSNKVQEQEANHFASELLLPSPMLKKDFEKLKDVAAVAKIYGVSKDALWIKLIRSKLI
jgi:Zn-dependent peptidase ImmA (M78 family)